jgi:hypothetical protein
MDDGKEIDQKFGVGDLKMRAGDKGSALAVRMEAEVG